MHKMAICFSNQSKILESKINSPKTVNPKSSKTTSKGRVPKKVLNVRQSGSITIGHPGSRHNTGKKNMAYNRGKTTATALDKSDAKRLKRIIDTL